MSSEKFHYSWLWQYAEETPFHGLSMARRALNCWEVGSWLAMVVVCVVMSIQQTITLTELYLSEPTSTSTTIYKNASISFPDAVLCVNQPFVHELLFETDLKVIQALLESIINKEFQLLGNNSEIPILNGELLKLIFEVFRSISLAEIEFALETESSGIIWAPFSIDNIKIKNAAIDYVFTYIKSRNISFEKLSKVTAVNICNLLDLSVSMNRLTPNMEYLEQVFNVCRLDAVSSLTVAGLCFSLQRNISYLTPVDALVVSASTELLFPNTVSYGALHLDLIGRPMYTPMFNRGNVIDVTFGYTKYVTAYIQGYYKLPNLKRAACSKTLRQYECVITCLGYAELDACGCWSFFTSFVKPTDILLCMENMTFSSNETGLFKIPQYSQCHKKLKFDVNSCVTNCLPDCNYQQVTFLTNSNEKSTSNNTNSTYLSISVADFIYPLFVENLSKDWQCLLNEFGGNIGLWLGGSLLAIIHLPFFLVKFFIGIIQKGKNIKIGTQTS